MNIPDRERNLTSTGFVKLIMKAIIIIEHPQLVGIFDKGDSVEIETIKELHDTTRMVQKNNLISLKVVHAKGDYKNFRVKGKNGEYYTEEFFRGIFGFKPLNEIFQKIV